MRRAVVVPGRSLGPAVPQLLFPAFAAIRRGAADPTGLAPPIGRNLAVASGTTP